MITINQTETGMLIRTLRQKKGITQLELAEMIGVSDKAVSKWERGRGLPDIEFFPKLAKALNVDSETLLRGVIETNSASNGNMKKMNFFVCPKCGNLLFSTDDADISCCGEKLSPLKTKKAEDGERLINVHTRQDGSVRNRFRPRHINMHNGGSCNGVAYSLLYGERQ